MIIIEGQIGAGKTTMGEIPERHFGIPLFREPGDSDTLNLRDSFDADKSRWETMNNMLRRLEKKIEHDTISHAIQKKLF